MKQLIFLLAIAFVSFTSCKKEKQPEPTPPSSVTTTPTPTVTVNDTIGKTKMYFLVNLVPYVTDVFDYKNDTTNVRVYLNGTKLNNLDIIYNNGNLVCVGNIKQLSPNPTKVIWLAQGDSLVVEFDNLEYNTFDLAHAANQIHGTKISLYQSLMAYPYYNGGTRLDFKAYDNTLTNADFIADQYLGQGNDGTTLALWKWNLGKKYRLVYIKP